MNWEAIGAVGEILGAIAVLVTLVYLAAQVRQNSRFVKAATYHSTMRARNEFNFAVATTPELSALLIRAQDKGTTLDAEERQRFNSLMWGTACAAQDPLDHSGTAPFVRQRLRAGARLDLARVPAKHGERGRRPRRLRRRDPLHRLVW